MIDKPNSQFRKGKGVKKGSKAGIALIDQYKWSSHQHYLSGDKKSDWVYKEYVFNLLTHNRKDRVKQYRHFISKKEDENQASWFDDKKWSGILGGTEFTDRIKTQFYAIKDDPEVPQAKALAPEPDKLISTVCEHYKVAKKSLYQSRRGQFNEPRNVALFLMRRIRRDSLKTIGEQFDINSYSSVSSAIERLKFRMEKDSDLQNRVMTLLKTFN
ncbi:MAG: helix-turn-helix domain-containing protein [Pseudomonadota bacterium]